MAAVIFDFGNVLIDWRPHRALTRFFADEAEMERVFAEIGFYAWNLEQDRGRSFDEAIAAAERDQPAHVDVFQAYLDGLDAAHSERVPGVVEIAEDLRDAGVRLFGLTNAARPSFEAVRRTAPVVDDMEDVVVSADVGLIKPDPAIYRLLLERNALAASDCLFIDDRPENCAAAEALGMAAHLFRDAAALRADLSTRGVLAG